MSTSRLLLVSLVFTAAAPAVPPSVSNIRATQRSGTKLVDILYTLTDPDSGSLTVQVEMSSNSGQSYDLPVRSVSGAIGAGVTPGANKSFTWNAGLDWNGNFSNTCRVRLYAFDNSTPVPPLGMVYVPAGTFQMGWESPTVIGGNVTLTKAYFMDRYEISGALWASVRDWGNANGYSIRAGSFRAADHPAQSMTWYDAVKWCNARSQKEGLTACYYTDAAQATVYRTGNLDLTNAMVKWNATGYRLPTETEWERAARGGLDRKVYPWGDTLANHQANYNGSGDPFENVQNNPVPTTPIGYYNGNQIPSGQNMANGYGLYDMAGNVWEWCWDWVDNPPYGQTDPAGPTTGTFRVLRGGAWNVAPIALRCTFRDNSETPGVTFFSYGFRCVSSQ